MGSFPLMPDINILKEMYGNLWHNKRGAKEELIKRINALSDFEKIMAGLGE